MASWRIAWAQSRVAFDQHPMEGHNDNDKDGIGILFVPSGDIKHGWLENPRTEWRF